MTRDSEVVPLGSVTTWMSGGTPNRSTAVYWGGTIPWISASTLKSSHISDSDQHLTEEGVRAGSKLAPAGASLVLVRGMALHREIRVGMATRPVSFNQDVKALVPVRGLMPAFLLYALQSRSAEIRNLVSSAGSGTGVLDTALLQRLHIWVPEEHTQGKIVAALTDADNVIATMTRLIAKKQTVKQGMMQQLLTGGVRLHGFSEPWAEADIGDLLEFKNGLNKAGKYFGAGVPIINFMDVMHGPIITATQVTGRVTVTRDEVKRFSAKRGDIFFTRTSETVNEVGTAAALMDDLANAVFSGFLLRGRPRRKELDSRFLARLFGLASVRAQVTSAATYTTRALTNGRSLSRVVVRLPRDNEQRAICDVLDDVDTELAELRRRLRKARAIKEGMMQELLSGRTRLPVDEPTT